MAHKDDVQRAALRGEAAGYTGSGATLGLLGQPTTDEVAAFQRGQIAGALRRAEKLRTEENEREQERLRDEQFAQRMASMDRAFDIDSDLRSLEQIRSRLANLDLHDRKSAIALENMIGTFGGLRLKREGERRVDNAVDLVEDMLNDAIDDFVSIHRTTSELVCNDYRNKLSTAFEQLRAALQELTSSANSGAAIKKTVDLLCADSDSTPSNSAVSFAFAMRFELDGDVRFQLPHEAPTTISETQLRSSCAMPSIAELRETWVSMGKPVSGVILRSARTFEECVDLLSGNPYYAPTGLDASDEWRLWLKHYIYVGSFRKIDNAAFWQHVARHAIALPYILIEIGRIITEAVDDAISTRKSAFRSNIAFYELTPNFRACHLLANVEVAEGPLHARRNHLEGLAHGLDLASRTRELLQTPPGLELAHRVAIFHAAETQTFNGFLRGQQRDDQHLEDAWCSLLREVGLYGDRARRLAPYSPQGTAWTLCIATAIIGWFYLDFWTLMLVGAGAWLSTYFFLRILWAPSATLVASLGSAEAGHATLTRYLGQVDQIIPRT